MDDNKPNGSFGGGCLAILLVYFFIFIGGNLKAKEPDPIPTPTTTITVSSRPKPPIDRVSNKWELKIINVEHPGKQLQWSHYGKIEEASGTWLVSC